MTSPLMSLLARSVAASALAEDCTITVGTVDCPTRATWVRREVEVREGEMTLESSIRVPASDVVGTPMRGDPVQIDGRSLYVSYAHLRGPVWEIGLTASRRRA